MRTIRLILTLVLLLPVVVCNAQNTKVTTAADKSTKIEAYYFHFNARCVTCKTVEAETKKSIEILYPELIKQGKISFMAINLDEPSGKTIGDKLGVNGQTVLLVKNDKKIDITNEGFLYAMNQPEKFKSIIKEKVDLLLK